MILERRDGAEEDEQEEEPSLLSGEEL